MRHGWGSRNNLPGDVPHRGLMAPSAIDYLGRQARSGGAGSIHQLVWLDSIQ